MEVWLYVVSANDLMQRADRVLNLDAKIGKC